LILISLNDKKKKLGTKTKQNKIKIKRKYIT